MKHSLNLFLITGLSVALFSCSDNVDDVASVSNQITPTNQQTQKQSIEVENGYLKFANDSVFKDCINKIETDQNSNSSTRAGSKQKFSVPGFTSISQLEDLPKTRSAAEDDLDEEMSQDEFNTMKASNLLIDPVLTEVMDTTLRIKISDVLYKVTQYGTFSVNQENEKYLQAVIDKFDTTLVHTVEPGQTINLSNGVSFTNSFGGNSVQDEECELVPLEPKTRATQSETDYNLQAGYNTQDYVWKNHSVWQKIWDKIRGKDVSREANFDKKHRVQVEVFDVNYRFYVSSGIKVKMQRRKKFCFVKYWVGDTAEKIAVGFNCITGELKWDNPASYSSIAPAPSSAWGTFQSTINNQLNSFIYSAVSPSNISILKDWCDISDRVYMCLPKISYTFDVKNKLYTLQFPTTNTLQAMYNLPAKEICHSLNELTGKVFANIGSKITPKDPKIAYYVWGTSTTSFNKAKPYIMGVKEYGPQKSKTVRFCQSFGVNFKGIITPFIPDRFKISYVDCFGAVKYNGQWKGIRFIGNK